MADSVTREKQETVAWVRALMDRLEQAEVTEISGLIECDVIDTTQPGDRIRTSRPGPSRKLTLAWRLKE